MHITGIYAALGTLLVLALALRVSAVRHGKRIHLGDGGDEGVLRRIRAHANAVENLPLALLLLLLLELNQSQPLLLHVCGCVLIAGRLLHALGMSVRSGGQFGRFTGTLLTWGVMMVMAVLLLWQWLVAVSIH
ncbi:MAPEG family protein [Dokdonella sp.]|uniref:MAPEG family protein n=1 Tax=Dokdonella sp. TaxID=2291710 RepID=UPI00378388FC